MPELVPWSVLVVALAMMFFFPVTITYVIIVHRALDVRVVLRQGIQYAMVRGGAVVFGVVLSTTVLLGSILYALNADKWRPNLMRRGEQATARYKNPDNDLRGPWTSGDLSARNFYSLGTYPITTPSGRVIDGPPRGTYWRV
jgi:hypothetical protein